MIIRRVATRSQSTYATQRVRVREFVHANTTWLQACQKKRAKTTHKLDGSGKGGEGEGKLEDDAPELLVFRYTVGSSGAVLLRLCSAWTCWSIERVKAKVRSGNLWLDLAEAHDGQSELGERTLDKKEKQSKRCIRERGCG